MLHRALVHASNMESTLHSLATGITDYSTFAASTATATAPSTAAAATSAATSAAASAAAAAAFDLDTNVETWPYVTVPNWQAKAISTVPLTQALVLGFSPFVNRTLQDISKWELYAQKQANKVWNNSHENGALSMLPFQQQATTDITRFVYHLSSNNNSHAEQQKIPVKFLPSSAESNFYQSLVLPIWQLAYTTSTGPKATNANIVAAAADDDDAAAADDDDDDGNDNAADNIASVVNYDMLNHTVIRYGIEQVLTTQKITLTPAFEEVKQFWQGISFLQETKKQTKPQQQPYSLLLHPILDHTPSLQTAAATTTTTTTTTKQTSVVGILHAVIPWGAFMYRAVSDPDIRGLQVVMDWIPPAPNDKSHNNSNNKADCQKQQQQPNTDDEDGTSFYKQFTYRIDGRLATFVGYGDLHEPEYDDMVETMDFVLPVSRHNTIATTTTTVLSDTGSSCIPGYYRWRVYPTEELRNHNFTPSNVRTWLYAWAVVVIFFVGTLIFLSYDKCKY